MRAKPGVNMFEVFLISILIISIFYSLLYVTTANEIFSNARNTQRNNDIFTIAFAMQQFITDNNGMAPGAIPICPQVSEIGIGEDKINLASILSGGYIASVPWDPDGGSASETGYYICFRDDRVTVSAPNAENDKSIVVRY
jgi:hypothetical protein